jgi:membrane protease YdiL (CAAX protease family)
MKIPLLLLYTLDAPEKIGNVPPVLKLFYTTLHAEYIQPIDSYIENNAVLSYLKHSEIARVTILLLIQSSFLIVPLVFYKKTIIKAPISKMKTAGTVNTRGKLLIALTIVFMLCYLVTSSVGMTPGIFPPFNSEYMVFWVSYIFMDCFSAPLVEELLFRGIVLDEIRLCYTFTPRWAIFYQALLFYGLHIIVGGNFSLFLPLIGIAAGIFCFYTNSLLYGLILHICWNIVAVLLRTGIINITGFRAYNLFLLFLGAVIVCLYLFTRYMEKTQKKQAKHGTIRKRRQR